MDLLSRLNHALLLSESKLNSQLLSIIADAANHLSIPIYIIGGMAVASHGYARFTADIDVLVYTSDSTKLASWLISNNFEDMGSNKLQRGDALINICTPDITAGNTKFPNLPANTPGVHIIDLPRLLAMKIDAGRYRDRSDFVELVKSNNLDENYIADIILPLINSKINKKLAIALFKRAQKELGI